jgi:hypothetical protein
LGFSIPTQLVEEALLELEQRSDIDFNFREPDMSPAERYQLLEAAYNDTLRLYRETRTRLDQLSEEHIECKSRLRKLSEEHAQLKYVLLVIIASDGYLFCSGRPMRLWLTASKHSYSHAPRLFQ